VGIGLERVRAHFCQGSSLAPAIVSIEELRELLLEVVHLTQEMEVNLSKALGISLSEV
jgi:hypothetical protein